MAASFLRLNLFPCPFITEGASGVDLGYICASRHLPQAATRPSPHRQSFASVDSFQNSLACAPKRSDECRDRAERGTKENDYPEFHRRRTKQHHGVWLPRGGRRRKRSP